MLYLFQIYIINYSAIWTIHTILLHFNFSLTTYGFFQIFSNLSFDSQGKHHVITYRQTKNLLESDHTDGVKSNYLSLKQE